MYNKITKFKKAIPLKKLISIILVIVIIVAGISIYRMPKVDKNLDKSNWKTGYTYVLVHGLSGWGSYDKQYKLMPYWGMFGGDLVKYLEKQGIDAAAASVSPHGSAWDRACELYAQLTGTRVDYGEAHSKAMGHDRYGEDFTGKALIDNFDSEHKINLVGHSFGGATIRLFSQILANGVEDEVKASGDDVSPFFEGGKGDYIYSMTTLAAPHNGTTAYLVKPEDDPNPSTGLSGKIETILTNAMGKTNAGKSDGRSETDNANYDMDIDNAAALNETIETLPNVYYFSYPATSTVKLADGTYAPDNSKTEILFRMSSRAMGAYTGKTKGGIVIDESWLQNDGLVNTISAMAPSSAPSQKFNAKAITPGTWNIMPIYDGDHMSLSGGLFHHKNIKPFFTDLISMINSL